MDDYEVIKEIVMNVLKGMNIPSIMLATVVSYSAPVATIKLAGADTQFTVRNYSGQALATNDKVVVSSLSGIFDITNLFIAHKVV